jgi:hypothetical protein
MVSMAVLQFRDTCGKRRNINRIIKENFENFLIHRCNYILLSEVYCVWQVVKTPTIISNNLVLLRLWNTVLNVLARLVCISSISSQPCMEYNYVFFFVLFFIQKPSILFQFFVLRKGKWILGVLKHWDKVWQESALMIFK